MSDWESARNGEAEKHSGLEFIRQMVGRPSIHGAKAEDKRDSFKAGADFGRSWRDKDLSKVAARIKYVMGCNNPNGPCGACRDSLAAALSILEGLKDE